jgi:hypothetical protein
VKLADGLFYPDDGINQGEAVMALDSGTSSAHQGGEVIYYRSPRNRPRLIVTSYAVRYPDRCYPIRDLRLINQVHVFGHPARTVALICGAIELTLAAPLAVAYGSLLLLCAGLVSAFGLAAALIMDGRRNPRWMALLAVYGEREITLFSSRDHREFQRVRLAVIRAVEANRH